MAAQGEITLDQTPETAVPRTTPGEITTRVIRTLAEIEKIRPVWEKWSYHPNSDIDFYLTNLRNEPGNPEPYIIVAYRDGEPQCLLVGRVSRRSIECKIGYKTVFRPEARVIGFVYAGLLGEADEEISIQLADEVIASLKRREGDVAFFMLLRTDEFLLYHLARKPCLVTRDHFIALQSHRRMAVAASAEDFLQSLSAKVRKNQKWQAKRFLQEYESQVAINCYRTPSELEGLLPQIESIAAKTYQRKLRVGFINSPAMRERLSFEAHRGWLRIYLLCAGGKPCAFWIGTLYKKTFHSAYMGYDPEYGRHSPGMFLITRVLESFCDSTSEEVREIDFGHGDAQYKAVLGTGEWQEASIFVFAPDARGLYVAALRGLTASAERAAKKVLSRTGLLANVKKVWRRSITKTSPPAKPTDC